MEKTPFLKENEIKFQRENVSAAVFEKEYADFIDIAVHDLDAPLRKLMVMVGMLTAKLTPDQDLQSYISRIENCVTSMRSLIDDLSVLAKVSSTKNEPVSCDIDSLIHNAIRELPANTDQKKTTITLSSLPVIKGNAALYTCLFKNLLENAIIFCQEDKESVIHIRSSELSSTEKDDFDLPADRVYYKIEISDNGIGFKKEHAEKIFRPFVRLHGKSQFPGNGIGLAICKKIVDIHEGIIYAESREQEGARFVLVLPETP